MKKFLIGLLCTIFTFQVSAVDLTPTNLLTFDQWSSGLVDIDGKRVGYLSVDTSGKEATDRLLVTIGAGTSIAIIKIAKRNTNNKFSSLVGNLVPCSIASQNVTTVHGNCKVSQDEKTYYFNFPPNTPNIIFYKNILENKELIVTLGSSKLEIKFPLDGYLPAFQRSLLLDAIAEIEDSFPHQ